MQTQKHTRVQKAQTGLALTVGVSSPPSGGVTGGQRFFPVRQVRIFRTFSPPLGGHADRRARATVAVFFPCGFVHSP